MLRQRLQFVAVLFMGILAIGTWATWAQNTTPRDNADIENLQAKVSRFLDRISYDESKDAFDELLKESPLARQTSSVRNLIEQTGQLEKQFGELKSFEVIDARRIGRDVILLRYLYKCQNLPVVWHFTFYRADPSNPWKLVAVRFDTDLESLAWQNPKPPGS